MGMGGKGKGGGGNAQGLATNVTNQQLGLQNQLAGTYLPFAKAGGNYFTNLLGSSGMQQSAVAPAAENISRAYGGTQQSMQNYLPMGGERNLALANLQTQKTGDIARLYAGVQPQAAQTLLSGGIAGTGPASQYGFPAAYGASGLLNYQLGQNAQNQQTGMGIGSAIGGAIAKLCWIAEALWGIGDSRTHRLRYYLLNEWPWPFRLTYQMVGRPVASVVRQNRLAYRALYSLFTWAERQTWRA